MEKHVSTTPFGRRPLSLGHVAAGMKLRQTLEQAAQPGSNHPAAVNKWKLFRLLTEIRSELGVSDRALSVLNALLSFHPETALALPAPVTNGRAADAADSSCDLVVFPSNKALSLRAHGMAGTTLWRHLTSLAAAGLIVRRDSPNGKRYARKAAAEADERFSHAFGFDLMPLVARAPEFEAMAEQCRRQARLRQLSKERISLHRRDVGKLIALGLDEGLPGDWDGFRRRYLGLMTPVRSLREPAAFAALEAGLAELRDDVAKLMESNVNARNLHSNDNQSATHQSNSNTQPIRDLEPASREEGSDLELQPANGPASGLETKAEEQPFTIGFVLEACPDVQGWATGGRVKTWPAFRETTGLIRSMLGISPDAWREARETLGDAMAHVVIALILQRSEYSSEASVVPGSTPGTSRTLVNGSPAIKSAGGYLRALTAQAREGKFAPGPVLMALIGQRLRAKRAGDASQAR